MKKIPLTQGKFALVDNEDFEEISKFKWFAKKHRKTFYAFRKEGKWPNFKHTTLHRQIMGLGTKKIIDHANWNGLDNRKENLKFCTNGENLSNSGLRKNNKSGFKGVSWRPKFRKYISQIKHNGEKVYLGLFLSRIEAAKAYDKKAMELKGEFALTNEMLGLFKTKGE